MQTKRKAGKANNPIIQQAKNMNRHFTEEDMPTANKYMQKLHYLQPSGKSKLKPQEIALHTYQNG